ncbi:MAG TPA: hypothetical protein VGK50_02075 [Coriobacteriia bacterium]|jgi:hypothetical protein
MYELALTLTGVAVVLELWLVYRYRLLLELFERNTLLGIAFSLVLSWLLGESVGAAGLTVLLAAVASTLVTATVYKSGALLLVDAVGNLVL